ncbi:MAG: small-conductance mechanosensitive channel [Gammaproteobacteria bacterium]|jgi:small-conductance mechanosensitive channel
MPLCVEKANAAILQLETYLQLGIIVAIYVVCYLVAGRVRHYLSSPSDTTVDLSAHPLKTFIDKLGNLVFPLLAILLLRISVEVSQTALDQSWLVLTALTTAILLLFNSIVNHFIGNKAVFSVFKRLGMPLLFLHLPGLLAGLIEILESISVSIGNIEISAYGIARVIIFGSLLFWLGRIGNKTGRDIISRQENLDIRTREVAAKLFEVGIFVFIFMLLLQIMGINVTALAVFVGAIGVGIGFGFQVIDANFISGIIILLDRSVSMGDFVEIEDGQSGVVRQLNLRSTTLEAFDGKDIVVANEKFIVEPFTNWTH